MTEQLNLTTERVDDISIPSTQNHMMGIPELLDECFKPHGNWERICLGWKTAVWLVHLHAKVNETAVTATKRPLGWRIYATNHLQELSRSSELQKHILSLWDLSPTLYDQLSVAFLEPT